METTPITTENVRSWGTLRVFPPENWYDTSWEPLIAQALLTEKRLTDPFPPQETGQHLVTEIRAKAATRDGTLLRNRALLLLSDVMTQQEEQDRRRFTYPPGWRADDLTAVANSQVDHGTTQEEKIQIRKIIASLASMDLHIAEKTPPIKARRGRQSEVQNDPFAYQIPQDWAQAILKHYPDPASFELAVVGKVDPTYESAVNKSMRILYGELPYNCWQAMKALLSETRNQQPQMINARIFEETGRAVPYNGEDDQLPIESGATGPSVETKEKIHFTYFVDQWEGCQGIEKAGEENQPKPQEDTASVVPTHEYLAEDGVQATLADGHGYPHEAARKAAQTAVDQIPALTKSFLERQEGQDDNARSIAISHAVVDASTTIEEDSTLEGAGAAVATVLIVPGREAIIKANVGDVKDYLIKNGKPVLMSGIHNIDEGSSQEREMLTRAGCVIEENGVYWKPNPDSGEKIQLTRALGDKGMKDQTQNYAFTSTSDVFEIPPGEYKEIEAVFDFSDGVENALAQANETFERIFEEQMAKSGGNVNTAVLRTRELIKSLVDAVQASSMQNGQYMDNATMITIIVPH